MVGRRDADHVDHRVLEDVTEVGDGLAGARDALLGIVVVDALGAVLATILVAVAADRDLRADVVLREELGQEGRAALDAEADHGHVGLLAGGELARADLAAVLGGGGERRRGGAAEQETSTVQVHCFSLLWMMTVSEIQPLSRGPWT